MYPCSFHKNIPLNDLFDIIYDQLYKEFGPQNWWPSESNFETIVGAILTQSVSWNNVEKAIVRLKNFSKKKKGFSNLKPILLKDIDKELLAELIRPSGYYNMKAKKLKAFLAFLFEEYQGKIDYMFKEELGVLRPKLLDVYGVGPETADSILLYAGNYPIFVVDAYTKRVFSRLGLSKKDIDYHKLQQIIMDNFQSDVKKYNEYHALIVALGNNTCKKVNLSVRNVHYPDKLWISMVKQI